MSIGNALSYLTVLPIPFKKHIPLNRSVHFFPLVGAGMGSVLVIALEGFSAFLPQVLACIGAIAVLEAMTGGIHLRAVAELVDGRRNYPGSGFSSKREYKWTGIAAVAALLGIKVWSLAHTRADWQPFAVLLAPILGRSSQALGIIFSRHRLAARGPLDAAVKRRQKRALVFTALLMTLFALFPLKAAAVLAAQYFFFMVLAYRHLNKSLEGLTVQTLGSVAELVEASFLASCALLSWHPL
jgi:adenosylcobinamide-GDP ribazoletransferase